MGRVSGPEQSPRGATGELRHDSKNEKEEQGRAVRSLHQYGLRRSLLPSMDRFPLAVRRPRTGLFAMGG